MTIEEYIQLLKTYQGVCKENQRLIEQYEKLRIERDNMKEILRDLSKYPVLFGYADEHCLLIEDMKKIKELLNENHNIEL